MNICSYLIDSVGNGLGASYENFGGCELIFYCIGFFDFGNANLAGVSHRPLENLSKFPQSLPFDFGILHVKQLQILQLCQNETESIEDARFLEICLT